MEYNFEDAYDKYFDEMKDDMVEKVKQNIDELRMNKISSVQFSVNISGISGRLARRVTAKVLEDYHRDLMKYLNEKYL